MSSLKAFIKDKWIYIAAILIVFALLYKRFGTDLFFGIGIILLIAAGLIVLFSETVKDFIFGIIGVFILGWIAYSILGFLFGKAAPLIVVGGIILLMYPKYQKKQRLAKEQRERQEAIDKKNREIDEAVAGIMAKGYFDNIFNERLKAFNAVPEALQTGLVVSDRQPNTRWLTLDQQLKFLEDNKDRMNGLYLNFKERNFLNIIRDCLNDVKGLMHNSSVRPFMRPLQELYGRYNFDYGATYKKLNDALYSYNEYSSKVLNDYIDNLEGKRSGVRGEERVSKELSVYKDIMWNLTNIRFEVDGESVESDSILITENGLFSVEIKNYGENSHDTIRITKDGQWIKEFRDGGRYAMKDVTSQLNRHIGFKQKLINEKLKERLGTDANTIRMHPLIVIANDDVYIENESDLPIVRASNIYHYAMKANGQGTLDRKYWDVIKDIILENNLPPQKFPMEEHFECLEKEYKPLWEQIKAYYVLTSMARTYISDLSKAGVDIPVGNSQISLVFNSEDELKG